MHMLKKKLLPVLLAVCIAVMAFVTVGAEAQLVMSAEKVTGKAGDTVEVVVNVTQNPGIASMILSPVFDETKLTLMEATDKKLLTDYQKPDKLGSGSKFLWAQLEDSTGKGALISFKFKIAEGTADGTIDVQFKISDVFNIDEDYVDFAELKAQITVSNPHTHSYTAVVTAPTCTEAGYTLHTCTCGDSYKDTEVAALGHAWDDGVVTKEATETETGIKTFTCTREGCKATKTETIPTLDHVHKYTDAVVAPTCTEAGYTTHTCTCGDSYTDTEVAALGHAWDDGVVTKEATETETGVKTFTCTREGCGATTTATIPTLDHVHQYTDAVVAPTCTEAGYTTHTCTCGDSYTDTEVAALGHSYTDAVTAPTCTEAGFTTHTCTVCEDSYTDTEVEALGHDWDAGVVTEEATLFEEGVMTFTCTREGCTETKTETISVLEIEGEITIAADEGSDCSPAILSEERELLAAVFTESEQEQIINGASASVALTVADKGAEALTEDETAALAEALPEQTVVTVLDISLNKKLGEVEENVTETASAVRMAVEIADMDDIGMFTVVRIHDGEIAVLPTVREDNTLFFASDRFSTYVVMRGEQSVSDGGSALLTAALVAAPVVAVGAATTVYFTAPIMPVTACIEAPVGAALSDVTVTLINAKNGKVAAVITPNADGLVKAHVSYGTYTVAVYGKVNGKTVTRSTEARVHGKADLGKLVLDPAKNTL